MLLGRPYRTTEPVETTVSRRQPRHVEPSPSRQARAACRDIPVRSAPSHPNTRINAPIESAASCNRSRITAGQSYVACDPCLAPSRRRDLRRVARPASRTPGPPRNTPTPAPDRPQHQPRPLQVGRLRRLDRLLHDQPRRLPPDPRRPGGRIDRSAPAPPTAPGSSPFPPAPASCGCVACARAVRPRHTYHASPNSSPIRRRRSSSSSGNAVAQCSQR